MQWLVKAKAYFELGNEIRIKALGAAVFPAEGVSAARARKGFAGAGAGDPFGDIGTDAGQLRDDLLDRAAGGDLDDHEVDHHDREQGGDHQQQSADDVSAHDRGKPGEGYWRFLSSAAARFASNHQRSVITPVRTGILGMPNLSQ